VSHADAASYDVAALRDRFPALKAGFAHFDGPGGSQVPDAVADAVARTLVAPLDGLLVSFTRSFRKLACPLIDLGSHLDRLFLRTSKLYQYRGNFLKIHDRGFLSNKA
jgi:hypothetical protein